MHKTSKGCGGDARKKGVGVALPDGAVAGVEVWWHRFCGEGAYVGWQMCVQGRKQSAWGPVAAYVEGNGRIERMHARVGAARKEGVWCFAKPPERRL